MGFNWKDAVAATRIHAADANSYALQRKRETSDTDGEASLPNTPTVDDKKKKKKKAKRQEAESEELTQETEVEVRGGKFTQACRHGGILTLSP